MPVCGLRGTGRGTVAVHDTVQYLGLRQTLRIVRDHRWPVRRIDRETLELTVIQRIWGLIMEVINVIAEFISCDPFELTENVINNNRQIKAVKWAFDRLDLAGATA